MLIYKVREDERVWLLHEGKSYHLRVHADVARVRAAGIPYVEGMDSAFHDLFQHISGEGPLTA